LIEVVESLSSVEHFQLVDWDIWVREYVKNHYHGLAIDTMGEEPTIPVSIHTNGDFSVLDSVGIRTGLRTGKKTVTTIPIRMLRYVSSLPTVKTVAALPRLHWNLKSILPRRDYNQRE